jgi:tRNA pseudouridine38-40 synthase
LNAVLPPDVRIAAAEDADFSFHPRYSVTRKRYTYLIANMSDVPPLFFNKYMWWIKKPLDIMSMKSASARLCGTHDFSSFRGSGCGAKSPVRTVYLLDIEQLSEMSFLFAVFPGNFIKLSIEANGFLRHMVRNIVGTLVETGRSRMSPDKVIEILLARDRRLAGPTAPAKGLFLERVVYPLSL